MSIVPGQLRGDIVYPTLHYLGLWSEAAENLIVGTIAHESQCGSYIRQRGNGPALGICQMEPTTHDDIWSNYLRYHLVLANKIRGLVGERYQQTVPDARELIHNLAYAVAMCRVHYLRVSEALPSANDLTLLGAYYKRYYNTYKGKATVEDFIDAYHKYILLS